MLKPDNPYRKKSLIWSVMEGDWEDLTAPQIAEVFDTTAPSIWGAIYRIRKETGYVVPHTKYRIRKETGYVVPHTKYRIRKETGYVVPHTKYRIRKETGYVVPHTNAPPGKKREV